MLRIGTVGHLAEAVAAIAGLDGSNGLNAPPVLPIPASIPNESIVVNCFLSLRLLSATDWKEFFEQNSHIEQILRQDPAGIYAHMDFDTRNKYRTVVEDLARHSNLSEEAVARAAIEFARTTQDSPEASHQNMDRITHVGFYLIDTGLAALEKSIHFRPALNVRLRHFVLAHPMLTYLGSIGSLSLLIVAGLLAYSRAAGGTDTQMVLAGLLGSGLALDASVNLIHWTITHQIPPRTLPRMDYSEGIPADHRTMVVIPTLLTNVNELTSLLQELELHFLRNPDPHLTFALLTDFPDASLEHLPEDEELLSQAKSGIENLNHKYEGAAPFYLLHRKRIWNPSEGVWMGWERKRGKLIEFNRLVLNGGPTSYTTQIGNIGLLQAVKYVITLDADTAMPQGSASRLVATLAHPLNRAEFTADGHSVLAGYTILQPRVEIKPVSANISLFSQIFAGNAGFDLYTRAVSDVYQDLFGEGSYVGKGIYDVAAFEKSLAGRIRENTLLSHDLLEGIFGRAALVTDILLYEDYPARYLIYARRMHRWVRGDWQLLPWLFPIVRTDAGFTRNRLSLINRWKIFDNLRRSLMAPLYLLFFSAIWLVLPGSALLWTLLLLLAPAVSIFAQAFQQIKDNLGQLSLKEMVNPSRLPIIRWALSIFFLPYEAFLSLTAIGQTLARLLITRRNMLKWTTAAYNARVLRLNSRHRVWWEMAASLAFSILLGGAIAFLHPQVLWVAAPLLLVWSLSPQIAYHISQPIVVTSMPLTEDQREEILCLARRTWAFFEQFAGPDDHWLPPDHFQENPGGTVAHYTTPTNIGLYLLSILCAHDLGFLDLLELGVRLRSTFENIDAMEHYRGHLLNWYNTQTLAPLPPRYVSTVDSGNLAACLIALKQGCLELMDAPLFGAQQWQGLLVILDILSKILRDVGKNRPGSPFESFEVELDDIRQRITSVQDSPAAWTSLLAWLVSDGWGRISHHLIDFLGSDAPDLNQEILNDLQLYLDRLQQQLIGMQRNIKLFGPWLSASNQLPRLFTQPGHPALEAWDEFLDSLPADLPSLGQAVPTYAGIKQALSWLVAQLDRIPAPTELVEEGHAWARKLDEDLTSARLMTESLVVGYRDLARQADNYVVAMDFKFLFDEQRQVFHVGYNTDTEKLDTSYYDLLASEARIASLIAIAKGDAPQSHWLHLGRPVTRVNGKQVLLSWSGTMFEYLMPALFTKNYSGTFLSDSSAAAVDAQISYAQQKHVPWGVSESGYYAFDASMNYQYRAFGVPALGYKRDLSEEVVIAPYASLIGLSLRPQAVLSNMARLESLKMLGRFGFYEALDYTKARLGPNQPYAIVQSFMAHHQGMILLAACNFLLEDSIVLRFHADERIRSVELLLQEKIPQNPHIEFPHPEETSEEYTGQRPVALLPWRVPPDSPVPQVHYLSQGHYGLMITGSGGGYSQWEDLALTRWQADATLDGWGTWLYLQDLESGALWSTTCQPIGCPPENQEILFYPYKVEFRRWDRGVSLHTEITIGADEVEVRRVTLLNDSDRPRRLKMTSYSEVVLAPQPDDRRHPAFNKLFIESEYLAEGNALLFHRRPRSADEKPVFLAHALVVEAGRPVTGEHESDRARFLGRGGTVRSPAILQGKGNPLPAAVGGVLDPILSLAQEIDLKPHTRTQITFLTLAAATRPEILELVARYQSTQVINRAFDEARARCERELVDLGLDSTAVEHIQQLLSGLLYPNEALRADPEILAKNRKGQSDLWAHGISGDYPILLVRVFDSDNPLVMDALRAYLYWRNRRIRVNLVILNEQDTGYGMDLHNQISRQIALMGADTCLNQRDGIFLLRGDQLPNDDRILLEATAGVILDQKEGSLAEQARRLGTASIRLPAFTPSLSLAQDPEPTPVLTRPTDLQLDNGLGGFSPDGHEYVLFLQPGQNTPRPWVNVIANPQFGFLVSEAGSGYTWAGNSGENRLTPWRNDPVSDLPGEALYLRDEETGLVWSPTQLPAGAESTCVVRHGAGYSTFESQSHGLNQQLRLYASPDEPIKIIRLRLKNMWVRPRRITVTSYAEWVLGTDRETNQAYVVPEFDPIRHALLAGNCYNAEFRERTAFLAASKKPHGLTTDRCEFIGRLGSLKAPAALGRIGLASTVRAGLDPCAAIQLHVDLAPGQTEEVFFLLGEGSTREESLALITKYQSQGQIDLAWQATLQSWDNLLSSVTVQTPDPGMDLMLNRWLLYQTISCRLWGRSALYQSSGAFGFRDQLQDILATLHTRPGLGREQILNAARRQFDAGDVLHWWHPPSGRGVRTRFSDDLLWLPYVTAEYVTISGDASILDEKIPFLQGEPLKPEELDRYGQYEPSNEGYSLYEHCRRAIQRGATSGVHGLPLMGSGDWNDSMNRVGGAGRGESIWLGWFLYATLMRFSALAALMKEDPEPYRQQADRLAQALELHGWDGNWYLRAFYDDGSSLGSSQDEECQIDSIAQSWAVLSGAANPQRAARAMESAAQLLVREDEQLILLLTPPFDKTSRDPGYIKGYAPGVRENGGQYTHAAIWAAWAFTLLGQGDRAGALFRLLNPVYHADSPEKARHYMVEPYAIAADIYSQPPFPGIGGWTGYTGSAGWMYRLGIEAILGLTRRGETLIIDPCIPKDWPGFQVTYRFGRTPYLIRIENPQGVNRGVRQVLLNGLTLPDNQIPLTDDGGQHEVRVLLGPLESRPNEGSN
jgi:cyclic beta-1,2-glucan synthetase